MLKLRNESLDWSLANIEKDGDTDIFPVPFEYKAIRYCWDESVRPYLRNINLLEWNIKPFRRALTPKHRFGFRVATQLDPLDTIIFNSLIYEIGNDIELFRLPKEKRISFSNRFLPNNDGQMFDPEYNWKSFQDWNLELCDSGKYNYVIVADIADFYSRIYSHPLENALSECTNKSNHVRKIISMIKDWNCSISYGIPIGPNGPRLLAELAIDDIDRGLISEGYTHCRYVDDFRFFCETEVDAYKQLAYFANMLFENHGLTLQQHKTKILKIEHFREKYLKSDDDKEIDNLSEKFDKILDDIGIDNFYEFIDYDELDIEIQMEIDELNLIDLLEEQIEEEQIDSKAVAFILNRLGQVNNPDALDIIIDNIDKLYTVFKNIFIYLNKLTCLTKEQKSDYGEELLSLLDTSIVGHLEYHRAWLFDLFSKDQEWNNTEKYVNLYNQHPDEFSRRKMILALGKSGSNHWFKTYKRNIHSLSPWLKRAFLSGASCLPGDEATHWYRSISGSLDFLEKTVVNWTNR